MIIDFLTSGSSECPLVRLYGATHNGFVELRQITRLLSKVAGREDNLVNYTTFQLKGIDSFVLNNKTDLGVQTNGNIITWSTTPSNWYTISLLIDPLVDAPLQPASYQWLWGPSAIDPLDKSATSILISKSTDGIW